MPNHHKDALMVQAVFAFSQGCGQARIDDEASEWFRQRYHPWIDKKKAIGKSPQDAWDSDGKGFLAKFQEIGSRAAKGGIVSVGALTAAATAVESESLCPYCPDKP
jgi:hypothetical protein